MKLKIDKNVTDGGLERTSFFHWKIGGLGWGFRFSILFGSMLITEVVGSLMLVKRVVYFSDTWHLSTLCPAVGLGSSVDIDTPHLFRHHRC